MTTIIGYSYEADYYCASCTEERFGPPPYEDRQDQDGNPLPDVTDREGNFIHPMFVTDERPCYPDELTGEAVFYDETCGGCRVNLRTGDGPDDRQVLPFRPGDNDWYYEPVRCNGGDDAKVVDELRRWGVDIADQRRLTGTVTPRVYRLINFHGVGRHVHLSEIAPGALMLRCRHCFQRRLIRGDYTIAGIRSDAVEEYDTTAHGGNRAGVCSINIDAEAAMRLLYEAGYQVDPLVGEDGEPFWLVYDLCGPEHCCTVRELASGLLDITCMHGCPRTFPCRQFSRLVGFGVALARTCVEPDTMVDEVRVCEPLDWSNADGMTHVWISPAQQEADSFTAQQLAVAGG